MTTSKALHRWLAAFLAMVTVVLALSLACAAPEPTPTPIPPAPPAPPVAPTARPAPTATPILGAPTPVPVVPTPTRVLPTATPAVTGKPIYGGTIRYAHRMAPDNLDPHRTVLSDGFAVFHSIHNLLLNIDPDGKLLPELAQSWEVSADGKAITFNLISGVKFHDGTDFNAQVVKWNFDRMMDPNQNSPRRGELQPYVERVDVVNETTVKMYFFNPFRPFLADIATERLGFLVSPAAVQKYGGGVGGDYGRNPVGTGPFRFVEWAIDRYVLVKRNENYWQKGKPYLDAILFQSVADPVVRLAMLRTGETDIVYNTEVQAKDIPTLERQPELKVIRQQGVKTGMMKLNPGKPPFDNKALRQAISYSIDRATFVKAALEGAGTPAYTAIATGWGYNPDLKPIVFDLAKAKQKLVEAGYPTGVTLKIGCPPTGVYLQWCEMTQPMMKEAGIKTEIELLLAATYFTLGSEGYIRRVGFGLTQLAHRIDPHINPQRHGHTKGANNQGIYSNPEFDRLLDEAAAIYDTAKAKPLYDRAQSIWAEDASAVFIARVDTFYPMNRRVQSFVPMPDTWERLAFLWLEK